MNMVQPSRLLRAASLALICGACSETAKEETVVLRVLHHQNTAFDKADEDAAAAYTKLHPNVTFEFERFAFDALTAKIASELPTGTITADVITMPPSNACTYRNTLAKVPADVATLAQARE